MSQVWKSTILPQKKVYVTYNDTVLTWLTDLSVDSTYIKSIDFRDELAITDRYSTLPMQVMFVAKPLYMKYYPINFNRFNVDSLNSAMTHLRSGVDFRQWMQANTSNIESLRIKTASTTPSLIKTTWSEIPEPWREVKDGRRMTLRGSDNSSLARIFTKDFDDDAKIKQQPKEKESPWKISGEENMQLSQLLLANWIKGGESSLTLLSDMRATMTYKHNRVEWESAGTHKVGLTHTSSLGTRVSDDVLDLSTKYGVKAVNKWFYSVKSTFKTQLFRNYAKSDTEKKKPKSTFLSPTYVQFIVGMDYKTKDLSLLLSPFTTSLTFVLDTTKIDQTAYGIKKEKKSEWVNGFSITTTWKKTITYGIDYSTKMELFYEFFHKDGQKRFDWENIISMQINRYLTTRLLFELRYYDNETRKFQVKENFSISFKYTF